MKRPIIIDCDPGLDDMLALALIGQEDINLLGITTVAGNKNIDIVTQNAINLEDYFTLNAPVIKGANKPMYRESLEADSVHGESGLGNVMIPQIENYNLKDQKAYEFLIDQSLKHEGKLEIIAVGPLTNVALAMINDPDFENRIAKITIMGGGHKRGNVTLTAEFNIYVDPEAAKIVFDSKIPKIMVGLDITMRRGLKEEDIEHILEGHTSEKARTVGRALYDTLNISRRFKSNESYLHDALAVLIGIDDSFAKGRQVHVDVETKGEFTSGMTIVDTYGMTKKPKDVLFMESFDFEYYVSKLKNLIKAYEA